MSWIAGIDVSTFAIDLVFVNEEDDRPGPPVWRRFPLGGQDAWERTRSVRDALRGQEWDYTLAIGLEVAHGMSSGAVNRVVGAVLACLPTDVLIKPWTASEWKKAVGLKGNADKAKVWAHVNCNVDLPIRDLTWPQDACDAYCIALATRASIEMGVAA